MPKAEWGPPPAKSVVTDDGTPGDRKEPEGASGT